MKKYKNHIRAANMLLQALHGLKHERLRKIQQRLEDFSFKCSEVTKNSRIFQRAVDRCCNQQAKRKPQRFGENVNAFDINWHRSKTPSTPTI